MVGTKQKKKVGHPPHSAQDIIGGVVEKNHQKIKFLAKFRAHCARTYLFDNVSTHRVNQVVAILSAFNLAISE